MIDCAKSASCSGSQSFFVGHNNPRFPYAKGGYLPALCFCPDYQPPLRRGETQPLHLHPDSYQYEQLRAELTWLRNKVAERQEREKKSNDNYEPF